MGHYNKKKGSSRATIAFIVYIAAFVLDIVFVNLLKDRSSICRWLWLPLISFAIAGVVALFFIWADINAGGVMLGWPMIAWGVIRGCIIVAAYFKAASGFGILAAIFLCLFMLAFNAMGFAAIGGGLMGVESDWTSPSRPATSSKPAPRYPTPPVKKEVEKPAAPRQGNLEDYFRAYACAPQSGSMYFWKSSPSMSSSFGSHSSYTITGTIGIKKQSVEAFHVTSTDMDHHLRSVSSDIKSYVDDITRDYYRDFPDDPTDFHVNIKLNVEVVDW